MRGLVDGLDGAVILECLHAVNGSKAAGFNRLRVVCAIDAADKGAQGFRIDRSGGFAEYLLRGCLAFLEGRSDAIQRCQMLKRDVFFAAD